MEYIVYCTTNKVNNKIYIGVHMTENASKFDGYIGCGVYVNQPSTYNKPKTVFQRAVQKYGPDNFKRIVLKTFNKDSDAYFLEACLVNETFLQRKDVYNMVLGGIGGDIAGMSKKCYQYSLSGKYIAEYNSQQQASRAVHRGYTTIKRAIHTKTKAAGYFWSEEKYDKLDLSEYKTDNKVFRPVFQYSETGEYDCCYDKVTDAARVNNASTSNIHRSCVLGIKCNDKYFLYTYEQRYDKARKKSLKYVKVFQYSLEGKYLAEYSNCASAERAIKAHAGGLSAAIRLQHTFNGYQWRLEKLESIPPIKLKGIARKVAQYDLEGNLICTYNTVTECTKKFSGARGVLKGTRKTAGGFIFKYLD